MAIADILSQIAGRFRSRGPDADDIRREEESQALDRDKDGNLLFASDIISYIHTELERRKAERLPFELRWTLNSNFLAGNQFCDINPYTNKVETYDAAYPWQEHNCYNKILPLSDTRQAHLNSVSFAMTVNPRTDEMEDYERALISTKLLRYTQDSTGFSQKCAQAVAWSELTGTAFWVTWWDKDAGEDYGGIMSGDIRYGLLTPYEVYPESVYKQTVDDQRSIIIDQIMSADDIFDTYGVEVDGTDVDTFALMPVTSGGGFGYETTGYSYEQKVVHDAEHVITYYERKSRRYPNGRMCIMVGDAIIYYGSMPYERIPIVAQKCKDVPGVFFGNSWIENEIPLQRAYNGVKNKIHDYIKTIAANTMLAQEGSIDQDDFEENGTQPGGLLSYKNGYAPPTFLNYGDIPSTVLSEEAQLVSDMEYAAGISQLMVVGNTPSGVDSGKAIENLRNIDNTRMSTAAENIRSAVKELAVLWLELYKKFAYGYRVISITGKDDIGYALTWCSDDINSYDIKFDAENELKMSEDQQREVFLAAYQMGLFADDNGRIDRRFKQRALELMKIGNYSALLGEGEQQRKNAQRENRYFERGVIPEVGDFDDHEIHINAHKEYALHVDFSLFSKKNPALANLFKAHIEEHEKKISEANAEAQQKMMLAQAMMNQGGNTNGKQQ